MKVVAQFPIIHLTRIEFEELGAGSEKHTEENIAIAPVEFESAAAQPIRVRRPLRVYEAVPEFRHARKADILLSWGIALAKYLAEECFGRK